MFPDPSGLDFVVPLGTGSRFEDLELRYCLRSLERHARGLRRVVIVGQKPRWLSPAAVHLPCPHFAGPKDYKIAAKTLWAFENSDVSEEILFGNDDYLFLKDFDATKVGLFQGGSLEKSALTRENQQSGYQKVLEATHEALKSAKLPSFHYDIHVPIRYRRDKFVSLKPWWEMSRKSEKGLVVKSIYGNVMRPKTPGPYLRDFKLDQYETPEALDSFLATFPDRWVISYGDQPLYDSFETYLYDKFPEKSRFEL